MFGALTWKVLLDPAAVVLLVSFLFFLLLGVGVLVLGGAVTCAGISEGKDWFCTL